MAKKVYGKPLMFAEEFIPQEYIAACYHVDCKTDADNGVYRFIYLDTNNNGRLDRSDEQVYAAWFGGFTGCGEKHTGVLSDTELHINGFVSTLTARNYEQGYEGYVTPVYAWWSNTGWHVCYNPMAAERQDESRPNAS